MINQKTDTFQGITLTVRARRGADVWDDLVVTRKIPQAERDQNSYRVEKFIEFVTRTVSVTGELGFEWPTVGSSEESVQAAYAAWLDISDGLMIFWANLIYDANQAPLPTENVTPGKT